MEQGKVVKYQEECWDGDAHRGGEDVCVCEEGQGDLEEELDG